MTTPTTPHAIQMFDWQQRALTQLGAGKRALFFEYGTGKTWAIIAHTLRTQYDWRDDRQPTHNRPAILVVFCKNHNVQTWDDELTKHANILPYILDKDTHPDSMFRVVEMDMLASAKAHYRGAIVVPYSQVGCRCHELQNMLAHVRKHHKYADISIVADESTTIKTPKSQVTNSALRISQLAHTMGINCYVMSGNPIPERPEEIWAQLQFAYGPRSPLPDTYYKFLRAWFLKESYEYTIMHDRLAEYDALLDTYGVWLTPGEYHLVKAQANIPDATYDIVGFELSEEQQDAIQMMLDTWEIGGDEMSFTMQIMQKYQQLCNGFYYSPSMQPIDIIHPLDNPKVQALVRLLSYVVADRKKIVVWYEYKHDYDLITHALVQANRTHNVFELLDGRDDDGRQAFSIMHGATLCPVIAVPLSCAEGINTLSSASHMIFFSNVFSNEKRRQAEFRALRIGNMHKQVHIYDLASMDGRDMDIVAALQAKTLSPAMAKAVVHKWLVEAQPHNNAITQRRA